MYTTKSPDIPAVFQIGWIKNSFCATSPNVMFAFTGIATTLYNQTFNEQYNLNSCGNNLASMNGGCCFSNIDTTYLSGYASIVQRASFTQKSNFPVSANGASYCHLKSTTNSSLYGYSDIWFLADGSCIENYYSCESTRDFNFYNQSGCQGDSKSISLFPNSTNYSFADMGNITGEFVFISNGQEIYTWYAYIPSALLVYEYHNLMEKVALVCFVIAGLIASAVLVFSTRRYIKTKSTYLTTVVISQFLWVLWVCMDFAYYNILFPSDSSTQVFAEFTSCLFNLASLSTVLNTANFMIGFGNIQKISVKTIIYLSVIVIHLFLAGGNYFTYWYLSYGYATIWQKWIQLLPLWALFMFIFNTVPSFAVAISLLKSSAMLKNLSTFTAIGQLLLMDNKFSLLVFSQCLNTASIITFFYIQQYTQIPGSDRNFLAFNGIFSLNYAIHSGINSLFIEHLRSVLKSGGGFSSKSKTPANAYHVPSLKEKDFKLLSLSNLLKESSATDSIEMENITKLKL
ncbi:hypothetical protein HDV06_005887 [Boothiomyces sp. JEL0866]|nr:hypothetical protein HDV06_005887 [Boothiomyces sp. JEL0866]